MHFNPRYFVLALAAMAAILYVIFLVPPLTSGGGTLIPGVTEAELAKAVTTEREHCQTNEPDVNCACFANKSGLIKSSAGPRVPGVVYADPERLARSQARASC